MSDNIIEKQYLVFLNSASCHKNYVLYSIFK